MACACCSSSRDWRCSIFGGVFLAVTGGEALYADMGHFGKKPIRMAWFAVVFPGLVLNYLGQGAFIIAHPQAVENPFFLMAPAWALIPLVILATLVTVIASQAVITGAFSIAQQAMSLGLLPRMNITHTSETEQGQIYIGQINWLILVRRYPAGAGLPLLVQSRLRLWHRRQHLDDHRHDAGHHFLLEGAHPARLAGGPGARRGLRHRGHLPRRQRPQARAAAATCRC